MSPLDQRRGVAAAVGLEPEPVHAPGAQAQALAQVLHLGLHVARWAADLGVPHLVLTGRRGPDTPGAADAVADIATDGLDAAMQRWNQRG